MAYTDEALKAKLSTLNETQDSIVAVSQWITFHKRHADKIAAFWLTRLRDSPPQKRLNYVYLVNDIVQNARARKRTEFPDAFSPLVPVAIQTAYRSATPDIQNKIRRVVEVWRGRAVFEGPILQAIETRLAEVDKSKGSSGKKTLMGNSLFNSTSSTGMPKELESLAPLQTAVTKATVTTRPIIDTAQTEYSKLNDLMAVLPSPPVHAARLSSLAKSLAGAESGVSESIKARQALIADLERILEINKSALAKDEETYLDLSSRRTSTEAKKREVEDNIMRGLSASIPTSLSNESTPMTPTITSLPPPTAGGGAEGAADFEPGRPDFEALTPEPDDDGGYQPGQPMLSDMQPQIQASMPATRNPNLQGILAGFGTEPGRGGDQNNTDDNGYNADDFAIGHNSHNDTSKVRTASDSFNGLLSTKRRKLSSDHHHHHDQGQHVPDLGEMGMEGYGGYDGAGNGHGGASRNGAGEEGRDDAQQALDDDVADLLRQEGLPQ